jgi:hypothetical protein
MEDAMRKAAAAVCALAILLPATGLAAAPQADACAASLPPEAKTIYTEVSPSVAPGIDLRALVKEKVTAMVKAGQVSLSTARSSAVSAGKCLQMLQ